MRNQFTFYASFFEAISRIKKPADRAAAYDAICSYALTGEEPDFSRLSDTAAAVFSISRPILDSSRRKAENGKRGGEANGSKTEANESKTEANGSKTEAKPKQEQTESKNKDKDKNKDKNKNKTKNKCYNPLTPFDEFWERYPRKVGKQAAIKAFEKVPAEDIDKLVPAVEEQKKSQQWQEEGGRYIPNPATWLNQGRWADELPPAEDIRGTSAAKYQPVTKPKAEDARALEQLKRLRERMAENGRSSD